MAEVVFAAPHLLVDAVGTTLGTSEWRLVDQNVVDRFADVTGDHQWIHRNGPEAAAGPYGGPIVHGFLTLSLVVPMLDEIMQVRGADAVINGGTDRVRFHQPVPVGSRIRGAGTVTSARTRPRGFTEAVITVVVEVEGSSRPVCTADLRMLYQATEFRSS